jgi:bacterioferritin
MKGDPKVIEALNRGLTAELTAINQYFIQAKICQNWGYNKLSSKLLEEAMEEMKHAEQLIERILFLEGVPEIARYDVIRAGTGVLEQLEYDADLERRAIKLYNEVIRVCEQAGDAGSRMLAEKLLDGSEETLDWLESQLHVIKEIGLENYLTEQLG